MQLTGTASQWLDRRIGSPMFARFLRNLLRVPERRQEASGLFQILVVRLDEIGDMVLTSGFFRELRRRYPGARITLVTRPAVADLYEHCPYIDRLLTYELPPPRSFMRSRWLYFAWRYARTQLWPSHFDLAIMPRFDADYGWGWALVAFSRAHRTVAYGEQASEVKKQVNRGLDRLFTDIVPAGAAGRHEVERNYDLVRYLGGAIEETHLEVWPDRNDRDVAAGLLRPIAGEAGRLIVLGIGGRVGRKLWPAERFADLVSAIASEEDVYFVLVGGESDRPAARAICRRARPVLDLVGRTTLRQTAAVIERCALYVGDDTGPMHIAAAAGLPVVEIACSPRNGDPGHLNSPARFGPWGTPVRIAQPDAPAPPCLVSCDADKPHCILSVTVAEVCAATRDLLREPVSRGRPL
jgi:heptosyltransferase-2